MSATPEVPEFVTDARGNEVRPGDIIAYAVRVGSTAALHIAPVDRFQWSAPSEYSYLKPILKIRLVDTAKSKWSRAALIEESHKRFVLVEAAA